MRTIILLVIYVLCSPLLILLILFCFLLRWPGLLIMLGKGAIYMGQKILGIQVELSGIERIDKSNSYVFMSNHLSFIDGPLLFMHIPQPIRVILKKEVFRVPILSQGMSLVGFVPVDRKGIKGGKKAIDRATRMIREKGFTFLIFPEGTRSRDGKLQPFKRGGFFLAVSSQVPVVPISISGTYELMPKGSFFAKRGRVRIVFHPAVPVQAFDKEDIPQLMDKVRNIIKKGLSEFAQESRQ